MDCDINGLFANFFDVFMYRDEDKVHKHTQKRMKPISIHIYRTSLVDKGFIIWKTSTISCGGSLQRVVPSGQDNAILTARVANYSAGFISSCQFTELAI